MLLHGSSGSRKGVWLRKKYETSHIHEGKPQAFMIRCGSFEKMPLIKNISQISIRHRHFYSASLIIAASLIKYIIDADKDWPKGTGLKSLVNGHDLPIRFPQETAFNKEVMSRCETAFEEYKVCS